MHGDVSVKLKTLLHWCRNHPLSVSVGILIIATILAALVLIPVRSSIPGVRTQYSDSLAHIKHILGDTIKPHSPLFDFTGKTREGRRINIAIIGVDSRISDPTKHADANHVLSIIPDSGKIEIISIPRDTPCDLGFPDSLMNLNSITNTYALRGQERYFQELSRITGVGNIHYWIEIGFSQAMGVIEWLGFSSPKQTLRVLRSRKGLGGDDYQRSYNQGQFIRQIIIKHLHRFDGIMGDLYMRAGLSLLNTNLTAEEAKGILEQLETSGFTSSQPERITVELVPEFTGKLMINDFTNEKVIDSLNKRVDNFSKYLEENDTLPPPPKVDVYTRLQNMLRLAEQDSMRPKSVIERLERSFEQRAWLQVSDSAQRSIIRHRFDAQLTHAYYLLKRPADAERVRKITLAEQALHSLRNNVRTTQIRSTTSTMPTPVASPSRQ